MDTGPTRTKGGPAASINTVSIFGFVP